MYSVCSRDFCIIYSLIFMEYISKAVKIILKSACFSLYCSSYKVVTIVVIIIIISSVKEHQYKI